MIFFFSLILNYLLSSLVLTYTFQSFNQSTFSPYCPIRFQIFQDMPPDGIIHTISALAPNCPIRLIPSLTLPIPSPFPNTPLSTLYTFSRILPSISTSYYPYFFAFYTHLFIFFLFECLWLILFQFIDLNFT